MRDDWDLSRWREVLTLNGMDGPFYKSDHMIITQWCDKVQGEAQG